MSETSDAIRIDTRYGRMWALRADGCITRCLKTYGEYCEAEADVFRQVIRPGMTVVEAGANIGAHTVVMAKACAPGRLIAFEPQQRAFQLLCANLTLGAITNVTALPDALGADARFARMPVTNYAAAGNFGQVAPLFARVVADGGWSDGRTVRVSPLDAFDLATCDFLKIDVEGWESEVLRGARQTISRCRPLIYVENDRADQQAVLIELLSELGYELYWHVAPLFSAANFNGAQQDITDRTASLNMFCAPRERGLTVARFERIDPINWVSPLKPIGAA
jgi:FkbM family methyltransferase